MTAETRLARRIGATTARNLAVIVVFPALVWATAMANVAWGIPLAVDLGWIQPLEMTGGAR